LKVDFDNVKDCMGVKVKRLKTGSMERDKNRFRKPR